MRPGEANSNRLDVITCLDLADRAILLMLAPIAQRQTPAGAGALAPK
jgi:hypothetical protein